MQSLPFLSHNLNFTTILTDISFYKGKENFHAAMAPIGVFQASMCKDSYEVVAGFL